MPSIGRLAEGSFDDRGITSSIEGMKALIGSVPLLWVLRLTAIVALVGHLRFVIDVYCVQVRG